MASGAAEGQEPEYKYIDEADLSPEVLEHLKLLTNVLNTIKTEKKGDKVRKHVRAAAEALQAIAANPKVKEVEELEKNQTQELLDDEEFAEMASKLKEQLAAFQETIKAEAEKEDPDQEGIEQRAKLLEKMENDMLELPKAKEVTDFMEAKVLAMREDPDLKAQQKTYQDEMQSVLEDGFFKKQAKQLAKKSTQYKEALPKWEDQLKHAQDQLARLLLEDQMGALHAEAGEGSKSAGENGHSLVQLEEHNVQPFESQAARHLMSSPSLGLHASPLAVRQYSLAEVSKTQGSPASISDEPSQRQAALAVAAARVLNRASFR